MSPEERARMLVLQNNASAEFHAYQGRVSALLAKIEYAGEFCDEPACPSCLAREWTKSHDPDCELAALLKT